MNAVIPPTISMVLMLIGMCLTLVGSSFQLPVVDKLGSIAMVAALVGFAVHMIFLFLSLPSEPDQPDTRLITYVSAFFSDWLTCMSGQASVLFTALAVWTTKPINKILWVSFAIICALFASFRVWRKERLHGQRLPQSKG
jgi:hypothetical protein